MFFLIFVLGLIIRLVAAYIFSGYVAANVWEYDVIAKNLLAGQGFTCTYFGITYHSLVAPLYSLLTALIYKLSHSNYYAMLFIQIGLSSIIPLIIFKITLLLYENKKVAFLAALLCVFHPGLIIFSSTMLHPLALMAVLFCTTVMYFLITKRLSTLANYVLLGFFSGLSILTRATLIPFIFLASCWLFFATKLNILKKIKLITFLFLIITVIVSPWLLRNYFMHKQLIFQTTSGYLFWLGNNEKAVGTATLPNGRAARDVMSPDFYKKIYSLDSEIKQNNAFFEEAFNFIKNHPFSFIRLFFRKLTYYWWFSPSTGINYPSFWAWLYKIYYGFLFSFFIYGIFLTFQKSKKNILQEDMIVLLLLFISLSVSQSLFYVDGRHRWEIESLFMPLVSLSLFNIFNKIKKLKVN
jgi:4-amino-4-deoxy-L-arabinose transferase-like glycosyltransferase